MFHLFKFSWIGGMLIFFVNEAIKLIGLVMIAEARLVKCKGTAGRQTANSSTIGCLLVPITVLDDKQKIFSLNHRNCKDSSCNSLTSSPSQIIN